MSIAGRRTLMIIDEFGRLREARAPVVTDGAQPVRGGIGGGDFKQPVVSESAAFHHRQIPKVRAILKDHGLSSTQIDSHGRVILTSKAHKRDFAKAMGYTRNDEYY